MDYTQNAVDALEMADDPSMDVETSKATSQVGIGWALLALAEAMRDARHR